MNPVCNPEGAEGPSFPRAVKLLACVGMGGLLITAWGARAPLQTMTFPADLVWLAGLMALLVAWQFLNILFSTTAITGDTLSQGWLWRNSVRLADISQVRWLRIRPLDRWMAPRLKVRTRGMGSFTFHAADPAVVALIDRLVNGQADPGPQADPSAV